VQPAAAEVRIDGERWEGSTGDAPLVVQIGPGTHRIDVRMDGYRPFSAEVVVNAGERTPVNISLTPEER
jgi:hypothetical protein